MIKLNKNLKNSSSFHKKQNDKHIYKLDKICILN